MSSELHRRTPSLVGTCPRGLPVVVVAFHRLSASVEAEARTEHRSFDALGRLGGQWDARHWADGRPADAPNECAVRSLSNQALRIESADAGWRMTLFGAAKEGRESWDGRGTQRKSAYDGQFRLLSVVERLADASVRCVERYAYGPSTEAAINRCGRIARQDDPAGSRSCAGYGIQGHDLTQTQRFLTELEMPDWPEPVAERDALLETDEEGAGMSYTTHWARDATGALLSHTDAIGNAQLWHYNVAGQADDVSLKAADATTVITLLHTRDYNASGQMTSEMAGNGVITTANYSTIDGRLQRLRANGSDSLLQDLRYTFDPVGNVIRIADDAQPTDWFNGEQVDAVSAYRYNTLYQLVEASGRETTSACTGPALPGLVLPGGGDASRRRHYTQRFTYDAGGNLLMLTHTHAATRAMHVDTRSNRSLYMADAANPPDITAGFDANGNLLRLENAQTMAWDARNQLQRVTQVVREGGANDDEMYIYGGGGLRLRKVRIRQARAVQHVAQVKYLPGLEIRSDTATGEVLLVATIQAGRTRIRRLHWQQGRKALPASQLRYSVDDLPGSSTLELDEVGDVVSHEGYYPYGGTAWWAARSEGDARDKARRYSGKERDATGLYYYGFRYYAPWLQRWVNPDPAGDLDGLNRFGFVRNNPVSLHDADGRWGSPRAPDDADDPFHAMEAAAHNAARITPQVEMVNLGYDGPPSPSPGGISAFAGVAGLVPSRSGSPAPFSPTPSLSSITTTAALDDALDLASELNIPLAMAPPGDVLFELPVGDTVARVSTLVSLGPPASKPAYPCSAEGCSFVGHSQRSRSYHWRRVHLHDGVNTEKRNERFTCPTCNKGFEKQFLLRLHEETHSENRAYVCSVCSKAFRQQRALLEHMRTHQGARHECPYEGCDKSLASIRSLRWHIDADHKNIRFDCPNCFYRTASLSNLRAHRKRIGH